MAFDLPVTQLKCLTCQKRSQTGDKSLNVETVSYNCQEISRCWKRDMDSVTEWTSHAIPAATAPRVANRRVSFYILLSEAALSPAKKISSTARNTDDELTSWFFYPLKCESCSSMAAVSTGLLISSRHKSDGVSVYLIITAKRTVIYGSKTSPPHHLNQTSADTIPGQDSQPASGKKPPKTQRWLLDIGGKYRDRRISGRTCRLRLQPVNKALNLAFSRLVWCIKGVLSS